MIFGRLEKFADYAALAPDAWSAIISFLSKFDTGFEPGRYEISGDKIYAMVNKLKSHALDADKLEYHEKYADIQIVLSGSEAIVFGALCGRETSPYDPQKDIGFRHLEKETSRVELTNGYFSLILPGEGHAPDVGDGGDVSKVVIKVALCCFGKNK